MPQPRTKIPPTGTTTLYLDWGALLARLPDTPTLASVAWTVPAGITEDASSNSAQSAQITVSTSGLTIGTSYDLLCVATLSNANVQTATLPVYVSPLGIEPVALPPALSLIVPGGGGGGAVDSVNGATGTVVLTTSNISEGTNLYYTDARFEAALGAAITTDFSAAIQAIFSAAGTALQPGANISTLTNDAGFTTFDGAYSNLSGIPTTFTPAAHTQAISTITGLQDALDDKQPLDAALTQLSGLAVANGQVIGWSGGVLANIAIGGGGDMSKSVYDTDDNGIVDAAESVPWAGVTSPPTTLAGYGITDAFDGAYSSLSGIPATFTPSAHNQAWSTITATPTTLAGYGITDAATSAQGALADTALQPGDTIPQSDVTGLVAALGGKADNTITLTAGTGLDGGGNLTANRSFALDAATLASLDLADNAVQPVAIANFETTTQLNARDTANRDPDNFSIIADLKTFLKSANVAAARDAIGATPHYIGQETTNMLPLSLTGGLWIDSRGWKWLPPTGQSIGSASSGASVASADMERLFLALWPHLGLSTPGYSIAGGVGASAAADWVANKALTIPDLRGRSRIQVGQGGGLSNRTMGQIFGEEEVTLAEDELPIVQPTLEVTSTSSVEEATSGAGALGIDGGLLGRRVFEGTDRTMASAINQFGGGNAHNNMQPSAVVNILWFTGAKA